MYHTAGCSRLLVVGLSLSVCLCVLAVTAPRSNDNSQPQLKVWYVYLFLKFRFQIPHMILYVLTHIIVMLASVDIKTMYLVVCRVQLDDGGLYDTFIIPDVYIPHDADLGDSIFILLVNEVLVIGE